MKAAHWKLLSLYAVGNDIHRASGLSYQAIQKLEAFEPTGISAHFVPWREA